MPHSQYFNEITPNPYFEAVSKTFALIIFYRQMEANPHCQHLFKSFFIFFRIYVNLSNF